MSRKLKILCRELKPTKSTIFIKSSKYCLPLFLLFHTVLMAVFTFPKNDITGSEISVHTSFFVSYSKGRDIFHGF
jgi:uncharacterized membrane protein